MRRHYDAGYVYFVTAVTRGRGKIFQNAENADMFLATMQYFRYYLDFELFGYVVMPDHVHLMIRPSDTYNLSKIMNCLKGNFARRFNQVHGTVSEHVWQRRFYEEVVRGEKDFRNKMVYMHYNPVKAGIVKRPDDYSFSSYLQFLNKVRNHVQAKITLLT